MSLSVLSVAYPLALVSADAAGGAEQILAALDRALVRAGHRSVVIACEGSHVEGMLIETPLPRGPLDETARRAAQGHCCRAIARALVPWTFDVVHLHGLDFFDYLPPAGVPVLATLHLPPEWYRAEVFALSRPDTWLNCVSASQQARCPRAAALLPYIGNGICADRLRSHVRKRGYALALGRICPEKGFHLAIEAAAQAGVPLWIAGEVYPYCDHEEYFRREILPRVSNGAASRYLGPAGLHRKRRFLSGARCLLVPSLVAETSSLVAMEALACGTPVIAFRAGALPEIIEHGRTGFLVNSVSEMAAAIRRAESIDPEICRRTARERFSADRMAAQYIERYTQLAAHAQEAATVG